MKTALTLTILVLASFVAEAQRLKCRLTLKTGETTEGYVADTRDDWTKPTIAFSTSPTERPKDIPITEIKELYIEQLQATFQGELLDRDTKSIETSSLENNGQMHMVKEFIMVERLVQGPLSLFRYRDDKAKVHYYVQKQGGPIEPMLYVRFVSMPNQYLVERPFYKTRLEELKKDCPAMKAKIPELEDAAMVKFVNSYNSCVLGTAEVKSKKSNIVKTSFGLRAGVAGGTASYEGPDNFTSVTGAKALSNGSYTRPRTGLVELTVEFGVKRAASRSRLGVYAAWHQSGELKHADALGVYTFDYLISSDMVSFGPRYTYLLTATAVKPFLRGSLEGSFLLNPQAIRTRTDIATGEKTTAEITSFKFGIGFIGGAGVRFKGIELEARMHISALSSGDHPSQVNLLTPELILGYYLRQ